MLLALIGGISIGFFSALHRRFAVDQIAMIGAVSGISIPQFWLGLMLMYLFGVVLGILPTSGYGGGRLTHLILPAFTLGVRYMALLARISRSAVLEVMQEDYVRTARAKGLLERVVEYRHIFRNALLSVVTIAGLQLGSMLAATVIVETVFAWPGIGHLLVTAIFGRDVPLIQGIILIIVLSFLLINFLIDLSYSYIDPRIRYD